MADPMQPTQTPRMLALQNLANQLPVSNSRVAQGQQSARDIQLQRAVASAPAKANITQTAQQTGAAAAGQAGQQAVERAQSQAQQQQQVGQLGLQEQQRAGQARVFGLQQGAKEQAMDNVQKLAQVDEKMKQELYDKQTKFEKDEAGRALFNDRQLADYAKLNSQSDEQFKDSAMKSDQLSKRKLQAMEAAQQVVNQDLNMKYEQAKQKGDNQLMQSIVQQKRDMDKKIMEEKNAAANRQAMWQAGGTIVGGVAGAVFGGPAGAAAGASAGGALGGLAGSQVE